MQNSKKYKVLVNNKLLDSVIEGIFLERKYIEFEINKKINPNNDINILVVNDKYSAKMNINWIQDGLSYYNSILNNGRTMFINCDMYDEFLPWKILIEKKHNSDEIYIKTVKHYINKI